MQRILSARKLIILSYIVFISMLRAAKPLGGVASRASKHGIMWFKDTDLRIRDNKVP